MTTLRLLGRNGFPVFGRRRRTGPSVQASVSGRLTWFGLTRRTRVESGMHDGRLTRLGNTAVYAVPRHREEERGQAQE
jgi:hypothetical protein